MHLENKTFLRNSYDVKVVKIYRRETMKKKLLAILTAGLLACSVGLVACGHTCVYDQAVVSEGALAQAATCTSKAYYYYSCECGNISTDEIFEDGDFAEHAFTAETVKDDALVSSASCTAPAMYFKSCADCGAVSTNALDVFTSGAALSHTFTAELVKDNALKEEATCTAPAVYYKSCADCAAVSTNEADVFSAGATASHKYDADTGYCVMGCGALEISKARVGEDANTLYFFDKANGSDQVSSSDDITFSYSTEVKLGNEAGSLALTVNDVENPQINWNMFGYEFNEGDYVVFYVYNDTDADVVDVSLGYTHRERCYNGQWTIVIWSAADVAAESNDWTWLLAKNYNGEWKGMSGANVNGTIYFSKAKVYSATEAADLTTVDDTFEYTVGNTTLIGKAGTGYNGNYNFEDPAFEDSFYKYPYCAGGVLAFHIHDRVDAGMQQPFSPMLEFALKDAYDLENCYVYMTIKGAVEGEVFIQAFSTSGHFGSPRGELDETKADGSQVYKFDLAQYADDADNFKSFRIGVRSNICFPYNGQVVISDITVANN